MRNEKKKREEGKISEGNLHLIVNKHSSHAFLFLSMAIHGSTSAPAFASLHLSFSTPLSPHFTSVQLLCFIKYSRYLDAKMKTFPLRPRKSRKRNDVKNKINELYQEVKKMAPPFLASQPTLALQIEPLDITPQGESEISFFSPLSKEEYNRFPLAENLERSVRMQAMRISMDPELSESAMADADGIFLSFAWLASCASRQDVSKDGDGLMCSYGFSKGWSFQEYVNFDPCFLDNWLIIYLRC